MSKNQIYSASFLITFCIIALFSCKKGDNDPSISIKSRDSKIKSTWKLSEMEIVQSSNNTGPTITNTYSFDGIKYQQKGINGVSNKGIASLSLGFGDKGEIIYRYSFISESNADTITKNGNGFWTWLDTDKSKSAITLKNVDGGFLIGDGIFVVDGLKSKQLFLKYNWYKKDATSESKYDASWVFERSGK